jgi:alkanesulfonate monooxygenase SsuD/methylene tetrahydromethanopterin reductase-like flavin-dependent oxidoreductase (luciferase family)
VQQPHPPIVIGGGGPRRTPRLAATFAAEYNLPFSPPEAAKSQFDNVRRACEDADRDPATLSLSAAVVVCCGKSKGDVKRRAAAIGRKPDELRQNGAAGSPAEVVDKLAAYREAGADTLYLQVLDLDDLDHVRLIASEVTPAL